MAQAKTLTQVEIDQVLRYASTRQYPERNRSLILSSFYLGLRVAEIASLKRGDIVNEEWTLNTQSCKTVGINKPVFIATNVDLGTWA